MFEMQRSGQLLVAWLLLQDSAGCDPIQGLVIPRLIQRIIDYGITIWDQTVVIQIPLLMLGVAALRTVFAVGNSIFSVQVGKNIAC
jgi:hypothetical protein